MKRWTIPEQQTAKDEQQLDVKLRDDMGGGQPAPAGPPRSVGRRDFLARTGAAALLTIGMRSMAFAQAKPVTKVGFILPRKGPHAAEAQSLIAGFDLFLAEHRQEASVIQTVRQDPGPDEERTIEVLAELLVDPAVKFLVGPFGVDACEKLLHGIDGRLVTFLANPAVRLVGGELCAPEVFRIAENSCQAAQPLAPWALKNMGTKVFLLGSNDTAGNEQVDFFAYMFERSGGTFVDRIEVGEGAPKIKELLETIRKSPADIVFAALRDKLAVDFLRAARGASSRLPQAIVGPECLTGYPSTLTRTGKAANGVRTLTALTDPKALVDRIRQRLNREVTLSSRAAQGYDAAALVWQALRVTTGESADLPRLITAVEEAEVEGARGKLRFDRNHEPVLDMMVQEWEVKDKPVQRKVVANLGSITSPDFGCGKVGFPPRPEGEFPENDRPEDEG